MRQEFSVPPLGNLGMVLPLMVGEMLADFPRIENVEVLAREFAAAAVCEYCACHPRRSIRVVVERTSSGVLLEVTYACMPHRREPAQSMDDELDYMESLQTIRQAADTRGLQSWNGRAGAESQTWWARIGEKPP